MMIGHTPVMADKRNPLGPTGEAVRANIHRRREDQNLSYAQLSRRLKTETGRSIPELGIRRIEEGNRRVDTDDLVALAVVLKTSPATLLMPVVGDRTERVSATGTNLKEPAEKWWLWLQADPSGASVVGLPPMAFVVNAQPQWAHPRWLKDTGSDGDD